MKKILFGLILLLSLGGFSQNRSIALKVSTVDTATMLSHYYNKTATDSKLALKVNYTDTATFLGTYIRTANWGTIKTGQALGVDSTLLSTKANVVASLLGYTPMSRTITINGTALDLTANRSFSVGTVTSVAASVPSFLSIAGSPVTTTGTLAITYSGTALPIANGGTGLTAIVTSPTASTFAAWDANKNFTANNGINAFRTTATAAGTTTLTVADTYQQYFTGTLAQTVVLPVATTLVNGYQLDIVNNSSGIVTVQTSGGNVVQALASNTELVITCINTAGGTGTASWGWRYFPTLNTSPGVTSFSAGTTGLTPSSATGGAVTLAGTLVVGNGGTGATTLTGILKGNGTSAFTAATAGTDYMTPANVSASYVPYTGATGAVNLGTNTLASGAITSSGLFTNTAAAMILGSGRTTNYQDLIRATNTSGDFLLSVEGSAAGTRFTGSTAYASVIGSATPTDFQLATNDVVRVTLNGSSGAATFSSLAGTGSRIVTADASGNLTATVTSPGTVTSGSYTPTFGIGSNITTLGTQQPIQWSRVGNVVTISGFATITTVTATTTNTAFTMTLPVASALTNDYDIKGVATINDASNVWSSGFVGRSGTTAGVQWKSTGTGTTGIFFSYSYLID